MRFNFRKIASVLASAAMLGSTVGIAAAASYPAPFVVGGTADSAVVVGESAANTDWAAAATLASNLQGSVSTTTSSTSTSVSGEAYPLFAGGNSKIWINDTLNQVVASVGNTELPTVLKGNTFSGNVESTYTQRVHLGSNPRVIFAKQPSTNTDPEFGLSMSSGSAQTNFAYNMTINFAKAVNFTHADSEGEEITLFGQKYTVASETSATDLVLLKTAKKVSLNSDEPSQEVEISGKKYTVELVSSSDTAATIKVTDDTGASDSKEISEEASKKVQ